MATTPTTKKPSLKLELDIGFVVFIVVALAIASLSLMSTSPEMSQTLLIAGLTLLGVGAAIWGK